MGECDPRLQGVKALVTMGMPAVEGRIPLPAHSTTGGPACPGFCCFLPLSLTPCKPLQEREKNPYRGGRISHSALLCIPVNQERN